MKKLLMFFCCILFLQFANAQAVVIGSENFDGTTYSFTATPGNAWYHWVDASVGSSKVIYGGVPSLTGDSIMLTTPVYDFSNYAYVQMQFNQICKVSPLDEVRVEYRLDLVGTQGAWRELPATAYKGHASAYALNGFSAASYTEWQAKDSLAMPNASWWKEEVFDLSDLVSLDRAQFRFVLKKGTTTGTNVSYGWILDNFLVVASNTAIIRPEVAFIQHAQDTVYSTGPFTIKAKVATRTSAPIKAPYLLYSSTLNNVTNIDSILMTAYQGDSLWEATIPKMQRNTSVTYSITGKDTAGNASTITSGYVVTRFKGGGSTGLHYIGDTTSTSTISYIPYYCNYNYGWSRMVFSNYELPSGNSMITDVAFYPYSYTRTTAMLNQSLYMKITTDTTVTAAYVDPVTDGATLVWTGTIPGNVPTNQAYNIKLTTPFPIPAGSNLMLYWINMDGAYTGSNTWRYTSTSPNYKAVYSYSDAGLTSGSITRTYNRSVVRFNVMGESYSDTSVALLSIDNPTQATVQGNVSNQVNVTVKNLGTYDVSALTVNWSVNGVLQTPYQFASATDPILWDFERQLNIGSFIPSVNAYDTLRVWLSVPNDTVTKDDTLSSILYGCSAPLAGTYIIGPGNRFTTLEDAIAISNLCGASADVEFALPSGDTYTTMQIDTVSGDTTYTTHRVYEGIVNIDSIGWNYGPYTCTITSAAHNRDSVVFYCTNTNTLGKVRNLIISDITFKKNNNTAVNFLLFNDEVKNVSIRNCNFILPYSTSSVAAIRRNSAVTQPCDSLFITNNYFTGGYYATYLYGTAANTCTNIFVDSNTVRNTYYYGFYNYYANTSYKYNTVIRDSVLSTSNTYFYGIYDYYSKGDIIGNRILQKEYTTTKYCYGIYTYYLNSGNTRHNLIANNEVILHTNSNYYGIYSGYGCSDIWFNSVHINNHGSSTPYGIYVYANANSSNTVKYNDVAINNFGGNASWKNGYPMYLNLGNYAYTVTVEDNNLYCANGNVGYYNKVYNNINTWMTDLGGTNSTAIAPIYADSVNSNLWADYTNGSTTNINSKVLTDIDGALRTGLTAKGCYNGVTPKAHDASLVSFYMNPAKMYGGVSDSVFVVMLNSGTNNITSATLNWSINGVSQMQKLWSGNLAAMQYDTIFLGLTTFISGNNTFQAYVTLPAATIDSVAANDTTTLKTFICNNGGLAGSFTIGDKNADFPTFWHAINQVKECGMGGDVTLAFQPGTYKGVYNLTDFNNYYTHHHTLTITSTTGDADDVILQSFSSPVITINNTENVVIDALTIDATNGTTSGIVFSGGANNITISNNKILGHTTTTNSYALIQKSSTGIASNITIKNNLLDGNYYGVYFYGGSGNAVGSRGTNIVIDSNIITNQYYYATYFYYGEFSVNNNIIKSRSAANTTNWYGLRFYYCGVKAQNNQILQMTDAITYPYPIYLYYINQVSSYSDSALIANNVIDAAMTSSYYGIYAGYFNGEILHNTIQIRGTTYGYGIYRTGITDVNVFRVKNNIIYTHGTSSYPIYLSTAFTAGIDDIDANDLKGGSYVGYASQAHSTIASWRGSVPTDYHSVSVVPQFLTDQCFDLTDSTSLTVASLSSIPDDINGANRGTTTTMGAYHYYTRSNNATPIELLDLQSAYASNTIVPLKVAIQNNGSNTLTSLDINADINGVVQTHKWTGSLAMGAIDTVTIASLQITESVYRLKIYTSLPNASADQQPENDTLNHIIIRCNGSLSGPYTVGKGEAFEDLDIAFLSAKYCGINGSVQFNITEDIYVNANTFQTIPGTSANNQIIVSVASGKKASLLAASSPVVTLNHVENIKFQGLNISDGTKGVVVKMSGICRNITFDGCNINGMPSSTNSMDRTVEVYNSSSNANGAFNIVFNNNVINGGYYNMYLYYIMGTSGAMNKANGWDITNNTLQNAYYYGIYAYYYGYYRKINNNTITSRSNSSGYYGLDLYYYNSVEEILANRIKVTTSSTAYGIYDYCYNNTSYGYTQPKLIANNEIIVRSTSGTGYGCYLYSTKTNLYNNSIYCQANTSYGVYTYTTSTSYLYNILNNNIVVNRYSGSTTSQYPIYINGTSYATTSYGNQDYNNYYNLTGSTTVASMGGTAYTLTQLKSYRNTNSINVNPRIVDPLNILSQGDTVTTLSCPRQATVLTDITGDQRNATTSMGAYGEALKKLDVALNKVQLDSKEDGVPTTPVLYAINKGTDKVTSFNYTIEYNGVTTTGKLTESMTFLKEYAIELPVFTPDTGANNITVYITAVNGGLDSNLTNDTIIYDFTACAKLHGTYVVGNGTGADFANIADFHSKIADCMVDGDIELQFQSGNYTTLDVTAAVTDDMNGYHLTINSVAEDSSAVTFTTSGVVLTLNGQSNLTVKNVTLYSTANKTVQITGDCGDITLTHCAIKSNPTTTSSTYACIYKASSTGLITNFHVNNCLIDGGYYGLYLYGVSSSSYNSGLIDSNIISNQYYYAIYSYYGDITINHNTITSRTSSTTSYWYAIYSYYNNGDRIGNRILQKSTNILYPYGMYSYYHGYYLNPTNKDYLFANNEIDVYTTSTYYGMGLGYSRLNIVNNSIRVKGSGEGRGIYIQDASNNHISIYNNNIDMESGYPVYITAASYINMIQSDYNNFSGPYFGYAGGNYISQSSWTNILGLDSHSVAIDPVYANTTGLETSNYDKFFCPKHNLVSEDINGDNRMARTIMGAYTPEVQDFDLAVTAIEYPNGINSNATTDVAVKVINLGSTNITSANIAWSVNGVTQTPYAWTAPSALGTFEDASINIGSFTAPVKGFIDIKAWLVAVNYNTDDVQTNDTIESHDYVCDGPLAGTYTVGGTNADFTTPEDMLFVLNTCGIDSTVEFKIAAGTYNPLVLSGNINGASDTNLIIITSATGNANDVKFVGNTALNISGSSYLRIKHLTFDASAGTSNTVQLSGQITDVEIYGCELLANPNATSSTSAVVRYENASGATSTLTNVKFIKNHMNGGYYAMRLYYTGGSGANMMNKCSVQIDSNLIENYYYYGLYAYYYNNLTSVSHNTFRTRPVASYQYSMYFYYYNNLDSVDGNIIEMRGTTYSYGIYMYYYNNYPSYSTQRGRFINNEIRKINSGTTSYGIYCYYYNNIDFYNNSVFIGNSGTCYGLYFYNTTSGYLVTAKNNIFHINTQGTGYPLYISSSSYATNTYIELDYNDYYSTTGYVAYLGSAQSTMTSLRTITGQDQNSTSVDPDFIDTTINLESNDYLPLLVNNVGNIKTDITGRTRANMTAMGAYAPTLYEGIELELVEVAGFPETGELCSPNFTDIDVVIKSSGLDTVDFATDTTTVHVGISGAITADTTFTITTGNLAIFQSITVNAFSNLNITPAGIYHVNAWIACGADTNYVNDSISFDYIANKVSLPIDETFANGLPLTMRVADNNTNDGWTVLYDSNATGTVIPATGNAMLAFDGSRGAMTRLFTRQLDFTGTSQPVLDFWYYHDTAATASQQDYTDVRLTFDGGETFTTLFSVRKNNGTDMGWKQYSYALDSFVNYNCVILVFEAMRMSRDDFEGEQYIDHIKLVSNQDLAVSAILTSELSACDLTGKELQVVLGSLTGQAIDFTQYPTSLNVTVSGATTATYNLPLTSGSVPALDYDTLVIDNDFDFNPGTYTIKAWIGTSIDRISANDTLTENIVVNPSLNVIAQQNTGGNQATNCIGVGSKVNRVVTITNNGNMDMEDIDLTMNIYDINGVLMT
ncbi:MAG: hypothetical protein J5701_06595, partial [Bacteroidales bacterium]|nr:hypothetical protein [Bacteroidales bacterium]